MSCWRYLTLTVLLGGYTLYAASEDSLVLPWLTGQPGGTLVYAQRTGPKTFNPVFAPDAASREIIHRMTADLIHINRGTQKTEAALAKSWRVSPDGLQYILELRRGVLFSDGKPFDADDVVFSFEVYLDEKVHAPQRDLLILNGKPIRIRKLGQHRVAFDLPRPYAAAERLFDGFAILPRHLLEAAYREGRLAQAWGLQANPLEIAGLGPFRLKEYAPGERIVLERNPHYWKRDKNGRRLPYLNEVAFTFAGSEDMQVMRFQAGESDLISRVGARNFQVLRRAQAERGYSLVSLGPGLEYSFLFFNLNELSKRDLPRVAVSQGWFERRSFREAVSLVIDRDSIVRLVYSGLAAPLSGPVPPGNKAWVNNSLPKPVRSVQRARQLLAADGFGWSREGLLLDPRGRRVEFSIVTSAGNSDRVQIATMIQDDLKQLGVEAHVAPLEFRSLLDRVLQSKDYEVCILSLANGDADPNADVNVWLSSGGTHLWNPGQAKPATLWEAEIDDLMRRQMITMDYPGRKRMFDRVQELVMQNLPVVPLTSPHVLVGARRGLAGVRPAVMDHSVLWNIEELYWQSAPGVRH